MHLVYSLPAEVAQDECNWLHERMPLVDGLRYWHSEYSKISGKYRFDVILKPGQKRITDAILARHGVADYTCYPKKTGLVSCFPNH